MAKFKILHGKFRDADGKAHGVGEFIELAETTAKNFADQLEEVVEKAAEAVKTEVKEVVQKVETAVKTQTAQTAVKPQSVQPTAKK